VRWPPDWERAKRQSPVSKEVRTEAEKATVLNAVTRRQPVPEKT
jgi:hypothetical protein